MASSSASAVQAEAFPDGTTDYVPLRLKKYDARKTRKTLLPKLKAGDRVDIDTKSDLIGNLNANHAFLLCRYLRAANDMEELVSAH